MLKFAAPFLLSAALLVVPASMANANQTISNNLSKCSPGNGPAVMVKVNGIKESSGNMRVQSYRGTSEEWLKKGAWLSRIEMPAKRGTMMFCLPVPKSGTYAIAVRHDVNGNGKTDLSTDGGGMSNDPSINIFNLGKPSYKKTAFEVGNEVKSISIQMKYM
ncbi:MAG: DUF2141 domain-containing protein [Sphingorhabdus sp.]|nr:DUF2141 domain-containing protein [Sphingorhabdus sp.]